jgi:hypothetical protein
MSKKATPLIARDKRNRAPPPDPDAGYHHGDLQEALIAATEAILADLACGAVAPFRQCAGASHRGRDPRLQ